MSDKGHESKKNRWVKITTGPFLIPAEVGSEMQGGRDNDRLIIILKNPTKKELCVRVKLGVCLEPKKTCTNSSVNVFKNICEKDFDLGSFKLEPHSCTRIERNIASDLGSGKDERNAIFRITAKGDFNASATQVLCGLAEISVIGGSVFNYLEPGLEQADPALFFPFSNFVLCEKC
ncbi:hypothetical protein [Bacillus sp. NEB1478]|uniref:hypothetical protein n=1 Tax=Bacillus sp. NEB1478 TaxID=3073816 RepID=UPI0028737698|nr:hypothetical protein [Bacillus sp. NEB1478]WNB91061.1 hypothetical protein RGB74_14250 [Bacillus sp. NEB1478]